MHTADLGRHLKNGELFLTQGVIPNTNLYSYTASDLPFVNHHWGSGVLFYLIFILSGFSGLTVFFALISLITFLLFFHLAKQYSNLFITILISLLTIPLITSRTEIRPEVFSYLFIAVFFWLLFNFNQGKINSRWLYLLPLLELLWVNIHIYFPFGLLLIAVFFGEKVIQTVLLKTKTTNQLKTLVFIGLLSGGVTLLNPAGIEGVLYPLHVFDNYGYRVLENQSITELDRLISYPPTPFFKSLLVLLSLSWIATLISFKFKNWLKEGYLSLLILTIFFSLLSWNAVRNFSLFAYFAFVITSINLKNISFAKLKIDLSSAYFFYPMLLVAAFLFTLFLNPTYWERRPMGQLGTYPQTEDAVNFFKQNNLKGPIFNNYDNGGLLILYLYPNEKVFVDNRPEAYPAGFFQNTYIKMQQDQKTWQEMNQKYNFNTIFFYRHDLTNWGQEFLVSRIQDPEWAPIYVDPFAIIFLKNNDQNKPLIEKLRLPESMFKIKKQ